VVSHHLIRLYFESIRSRGALVSVPDLVTFIGRIAHGLVCHAVSPFPQDLLEPSESPNIYVTSPTSGGPPRSFPPPLTTTLSTQSLHSLQSLSSPGSSPTTTDFPNQMQMHPPSAPALSRQHSYQQMGYANRTETAPTTPLPPSPGSGPMDSFDVGEGSDGRSKAKRQRTTNESNGSGCDETSSPGANGSNSKRMSRARSDSAPLGYTLSAGLNASWQGATRPRSGSGMTTGRSIGVGMSSVSGTSLSRANGGGSGSGTPLLSIPTLANNSPGC
jgi:hypothetical protein